MGVQRMVGWRFLDYSAVLRTNMRFLCLQVSIGLYLKLAMKKAIAFDGLRLKLKDIDRIQDGEGSTDE